MYYMDYHICFAVYYSVIVLYLVPDVAAMPIIIYIWSGFQDGDVS